MSSVGRIVFKIIVKYYRWMLHVMERFNDKYYYFLTYAKRWVSACVCVCVLPCVILHYIWYVMLYVARSISTIHKAFNKMVDEAGKKRKLMTFPNKQTFPEAIELKTFISRNVNGYTRKFTSRLITKWSH